ncbi:hypothetical protein NECAME_13798 [Necator americanus]|uniref:Uncharacterized protein n=1 Tax=Necator americanus TaxID=51031 RepID=W2SSY3_NECAM|nr:hypothetical protein NECAME_13798 [Necator americanus]ETN72633.1 hypothetical protein NECAME_13798 [Necator americanus]
MSQLSACKVVLTRFAKTSAMNNPFDRRERTVFVSMIDKSITDDGLYELMKQNANGSCLIS